MPRRTTSVSDRFERLVVRNADGCWGWSGTPNADGYCRLGIGGRGGRSIQAHRLSYELHVGPIPPGMFVCHRCDNRQCTRPDHLFLGPGPRHLPPRLSGVDHWSNKRPDKRLRGERHGRAVLTEAAVVDIRRRLRAGESPSAIGREYGVTGTAIYLAGSGVTWAHVKDAS